MPRFNSDGNETSHGHPAASETFELNAIAAAVLGGTSLMGGRGTVGGTIIGAFVIGVLSDGLVMCGVSSFWPMVIKGAVIIAAVEWDRDLLALFDIPQAALPRVTASTGPFPAARGLDPLPDGVPLLVVMGDSTRRSTLTARAWRGR